MGEICEKVRNVRKCEKMCEMCENVRKGKKIMRNNLN